VHRRVSRRCVSPRNESETRATKRVPSSYLLSYPQNTLWQRRAGYRFSVDAVLLGSEFTAEYEILKHLALTGMVSYVRGELTDRQTPLPWMPPLSSKLQLKFTRENWGFGASLRSAAPQARLGEFEERTAGFTVLDLNAQYLLSRGHLLHAFDAILENISNTEYRRHLSRVKSIVPEPGRNFKLLYRIYF